MRKIATFFFSLGVVLQYLLAFPGISNAQAGDAWQLIAEVNALRAAYGLPAYEVNTALMSAAQMQSDYQASIGTWTHTGSGGSRPHDRAVASGYGVGAQVFVSENVATGIDLSASRVVNEMWQDSIHLETMISSLYTHIGAGVGQADGWVYYTIVVGYIAGSPGSETVSEAPLSPVETAAAAPVLPTVNPAELISIATPAADGSVQHVVQSGQFLETIANAYEIELNDLLVLNGLSDQSVIFPGDKLLIQAGSELSPDPGRSEVPTVTIEPTSLPAATSTPIPRQAEETPVPTEMSNPVSPSPTSRIATAQQESIDDQAENEGFLLYVVFGLAMAGTAMILFATALNRR